MWVAIMLIALFVIIYPFVSAVINLQSAKSDDNAEEKISEGKILEKNTESTGSSFLGGKNTIEWVVFESATGKRKRLRNVKLKEIMLAPGDEGIMIYRGETIYGFIKKNTEDKV